MLTPPRMQSQDPFPKALSDNGGLASGDRATEQDNAQPARPWLARLCRAIAKDVENLNLRLFLANLLVALLPDGSFSRLRTAIYRLGGLRIGPYSRIDGRIQFTGNGDPQQRLRIGASTFINSNLFVDLNADVHIGDKVGIGHHVTLITADHKIGPSACRVGDLRPEPINIQDGCWIGACSTILPGVTIGKSSIVAAGSVVSGKVPANKMVGGAPARPLKSLPEMP